MARLTKFGLTDEQAEHFQQFMGLSGEAAVWQWLHGSLEDFWAQQSWLMAIKALTDGGHDLPGLDVKTRDLMHFPEIHLPDLIISPDRIRQDVHYVLTIVCLTEPIKPVEVDVVIAGTISGKKVSEQKENWFDHALQKVIIPQAELLPIETLQWPEHPQHHLIFSH